MDHAQPIPAPIAEAITAGVTPAKAFRIYANTSIPEVAEAARLETRRLCLIEAGVAPTVGEAAAIAQALSVSPHLIGAGD